MTRLKNSTNEMGAIRILIKNSGLGHEDLINFILMEDASYILNHERLIKFLEIFELSNTRKILFNLCKLKH